MHGERFPRLSFCDYETGASTFLRAIAILRPAHVLPVSCRAKRFATGSRARASIAEDRQKTSDCPHASTDRGAADGTRSGREKPGRARLDAAARYRDHGAFL